LTGTIPTPELSLDRAYKICRAIAKREAKNFYYAFVALPAERRNAICAIYAFMRQADDIADDESLSILERRACLETWFDAWDETVQRETTLNPVFLAVHHATRRFNIPLKLLDELIAGVAMDLREDKGDGHDTYRTFTELYRYCYLVASVVGLVCIRIFGYRDLRAERLAEETGIAFQLTNILRDVSEDASRNRIYLPLADLAAHNVTVDSLLHRPVAAPPTPEERKVLLSMARRAERYYCSAKQLLPLIDSESRPALWVLVSIYHALLKRIERADYDVFSKRASVPAYKKLAILAVGIGWMLWARIFR
jgi:phytoene synthase